MFSMLARASRMSSCRPLGNFASSISKSVMPCDKNKVPHSNLGTSPKMRISFEVCVEGLTPVSGIILFLRFISSLAKWVIDLWNATSSMPIAFV